MVANDSRKPIKLAEGEVIGYLHNPATWLDNHEVEHKEAMLAAAHAVHSLVKDLAKSIEPPDPEVEAQPEVDGGPKTSETPDITVINSSQLLNEIDFNEALGNEELEALKRIILKHEKAFGLDGRLGHYEAKVQINLKEGAEPVTMRPYVASPMKREIIDKQLDVWLAAGVIEESKSPWGFPVIIVFRNEKPRFCVDYRKLNEVTVPDEYPIPRQSDILQTLIGSQYLSTFDALSGFTQLEIEEKDRPLTAFRTHRGLHQFRRLPFGLRNGPSVFQRVMNDILANYLWIFILVYIDDIVTFSKTFRDHLKHVDLVLEAIEKSGLTLSPSKCHIGYQSLLLLGQKVSRLGISTHQEKVDAIVALKEPKNTNELHTFLGMMVYFSSYIPFYAWIVDPLFALLRKKAKWEWTELQQEAFELSKGLLQSSHTLYQEEDTDFIQTLVTMGWQPSSNKYNQFE
jgi:hypothetical protein